MSPERPIRMEPRVETALDELRGMIRGHYPDASFQVARAEDDPEAVHLITTVDVEDPDAVVDLVIDRLLELQIDEHMPVHVIPVRPVERVLQELIPTRRRRARPSADLEGPRAGLHP